MERSDYFQPFMAMKLVGLLFWSCIALGVDPWIKKEGTKAGEKLGEGEYASVYLFSSPEFPQGAAIKLYKPDGTGISERANISLKQLEEYYQGYKLLENALGDKAVRVYGKVDYNGMRGIVMELLPDQYYKMDIGSLIKKHPFINQRTADDWHRAMTNLIQNKIYSTDYNVAVLPDGRIKFYDGDFAFRWSNRLSEDRALKDMESTRVEVLEALIQENIPNGSLCKYGLAGVGAASNDQR